MSKKFYCSICGIELTHSRKAIPGKGTILDIIDPHDCEGHAIKSNEFEAPTVKDILNNLKPLGKTVKVSGDRESTGSTLSHQDRRDGVRSTAPQSLLDRIRTNKVSEGDEGV